jgi:hypothetical protein
MSTLPQGIRFEEPCNGRPADATLWPTISGGCHLGRDTEKALEDSGFRVERIERFVFNVSALDPPKVTFSEPPAGSELIADSFGCGLDSMQRFLDAAAKLPVARDGQFGYPVSDRAPQKTVGLNHLGAGTDLPKFVAPQSFFPALLVQGCERKLPPGIGNRDDRIGVPADLA